MNSNHNKQLEKIIRRNLSRRGMSGVGLEGELIRAAESLYRGDTILIVTGFVIRDVMKGETDGPPGAVSLAGALEKLGKRVVLLTDKYSYPLLDNCRRASGISCETKIVPENGEKEYYHRLLELYRPTHVVAVERPGRAADGHCYSMRGEDISDIVPDTDALFELAERKGITTVAVGDGGNELGMGKVRNYIQDSIYLGDRICARVAADFLVIAGVSNWGGHALGAALSMIRGNMLLYGPETEKKLLKCMVKAGAVDGCTKRREMTVDGLSLEENLEVLEQLRDVVRAAIG